MHSYSFTFGRPPFMVTHGLCREYALSVRWDSLRFAPSLDRSGNELDYSTYFARRKRLHELPDYRADYRKQCRTTFPKIGSNE